MIMLDNLIMQPSILGDLFTRHPEALEAFREEAVKLRIVLEGEGQGKFFVEIWNLKKKVSFTCENIDGSDIEIFVDDLKLELKDLGIDLLQSGF